ncbi:hypothetical protein P3628_23900, partial [Vibrio parahaemolyticus]|nr:hypothetical protein [Vibrio parahaemolyticus]
QVNTAKRALDDRFNPHDHVEVSVESLFDTIARGPSTTEQLIGAFNELEESRVPTIEFSSADLASDADTLLIANETWQELVQLKGSFTHDLNEEWNIEVATSILDRLQDAVWKLERQYASVDKGILIEDDKSKLENVRIRLQELSSSCFSLREILRNSNFIAESLRCALIYGPAGAGKSHILG